MCCDDTKIYIPTGSVPADIPENETEEVRIFSGKASQEG